MDADEFDCETAFRRWCADELIDPRLRDILEEAFVNGWLARAAYATAVPAASALSTRLRKVALRRGLN